MSGESPKLVLRPGEWDRMAADGMDMSQCVRQIDGPIPVAICHPQQAADIKRAARPVPEIMRRVPESHILKMNRRERRAAIKQTGRTWAQAREIAKRNDEMERRTAEFAAQAAKFSPYEARKALAEWAQRGGK